MGALIAEADIVDDLNRLAAAIKAIDEAEAPMRERIAALEEQMGALCPIARMQVAGLEAAIKAAVLEAGETAKGESLMAVFSRGRQTWDGSKLAGFALAHPEILAASKTGKPSVNIRRVT